MRPMRLLCRVGKALAVRTSVSRENYVSATWNPGSGFQQMVVLEVTCPAEVAAGGLVTVQRPSDGASFDVEVPASVEPGMAFTVELPDAETEAEAAGAEEALAKAVEAKRLSAEQAEALRGIDAALRDFDALGWFIEQHCRYFREWSREGEQQLEWSAYHAEYVRLVEGRVEQQLARLGADGDDLYALLAEVVGGDERADKFLKRCPPPQPRPWHRARQGQRARLASPAGCWRSAIISTFATGCGGWAGWRHANLRHRCEGARRACRVPGRW